MHAGLPYGEMGREEMERYPNKVGYYGNEAMTRGDGKRAPMDAFKMNAAYYSQKQREWPKTRG